MGFAGHSFTSPSGAPVQYLLPAAHLAPANGHSRIWPGRLHGYQRIGGPRTTRSWASACCGGPHGGQRGRWRERERHECTLRRVRQPPRRKHMHDCCWWRCWCWRLCWRGQSERGAGGVCPAAGAGARQDAAGCGRGTPGGVRLLRRVCTARLCAGGQVGVKVRMIKAHNRDCALGGVAWVSGRTSSTPHGSLPGGPGCRTTIVSQW